MGTAKINLLELANGCVQQEATIDYEDPYDKRDNRIRLEALYCDWSF
jgi:hypothetical protein